MLILSWNIMQGGGRRMRDILATIEGHRADTVALSEVSATRHGELRAGLEALGFAHVHAPALPQGQRGVLIASKSAFRKQPSRESHGLPHHRWAEVRFAQKRFTLVCTYFPDTGPAIRAFWPKAHEVCAKLSRDPVLLVGDLNSGQSALDAERGTLSSNPWFTAMPLLGFTDLWRHRHRSRLEYSWYSKRGGADLNGFRIDHAFGTDALRRRVRRCEYSHDERTRGISDHSALLVSVH